MFKTINYLDEEKQRQKYARQKDALRKRRDEKTQRRNAERENAYKKTSHEKIRDEKMTGRQKDDNTRSCSKLPTTVQCTRCWQCPNANLAGLLGHWSQKWTELLKPHWNSIGHCQHSVNCGSLRTGPRKMIRLFWHKMAQNKTLDISSQCNSIKPHFSLSVLAFIITVRWIL